MSQLTAILPLRLAGYMAGCWLVIAITGFSGPATALAQENAGCPNIPRRIPPVGMQIPAKLATAWRGQIDSLRQECQTIDSPLEADVAVLLKACEYAIEHREFYRESDFKKVDRLLDLARERIAQLRSGKPAWLSRSGRQVRGFRSRVDGSVQPIGVVFDKAVADASAQVPLYVWLHGRGDKVTDLHFICERLDKDGQILPEGAIVLHPFGRQCVGYKSAGETDVMEAIDFVVRNYPVDERRIVLMGFSMGGAGVWHLAAHYGQRFVAASPGAGFAETARYQGLMPEQFPPEYEQMLWSVYDVPGYTRNLFNLPLVAYSGELDKQIQAARVMEQAYESEGRKLTHLIGPGMGHKYHPDTLSDILSRLAASVREGQPRRREQIFIQTHHWRYGARDWVTIDGLVEQYRDTRVNATCSSSGWEVESSNVSRLVVDTSRQEAPQASVELDGQTLQLKSKQLNRLHRAEDGSWHVTDQFAALRKRPGISGPIDDAFIDPFLVVVPTQPGSSRADRWVNCELKHFQARWKALFRGELRMKPDTEVTQQDMANYHLVLWGTPRSNPLLKGLLLDSPRLPMDWTAEQIRIGGEAFDAANHLPMLIYPNPRNLDRYMVLNSGPTFREAHDRTNSLQNPRLPDWTIISLDVPSSAEAAGKIVRAGFFDDAWQCDNRLCW